MKFVNSVIWKYLFISLAVGDHTYFKTPTKLPTALHDILLLECYLSLILGKAVVVYLYAQLFNTYLLPI